MPRLLTTMAIGMLLVAGCSPLTVEGRPLDGTSWQAISIAGEAPIADPAPTLIFDGGRIRGFGGCNGYSGQAPVSISNGQIALGQMLITLGACVGADGRDLPAMAMERAFWTTLGAVDRIQFSGDQLVLRGTSGEIVFTRQP